MKDFDRAIADYDAALKLDSTFQRAYNNRGTAWRKKGDRARALQDYAEAVRLDPSDKTAAANHQELALEVERLGTLTYQKNLPSFNCATARRQVEKAICADPGLAQLDRNINDVFLRAIASAEAGSHRAALALTEQQRDFHRHAQRLVRPARLRPAPGDGGAAGQAQRHRPAVGLSLTAKPFRLDLPPLPVTMPARKFGWD